ncbi:MAG: cytochrome d ubiquinol oxidase subunit II [Alicyclobacillaceae bacterium]|jgi:cytochrome d ubiquinol oxidase subunit II|uniref:cytochrome d ubiquinol oxidase subunit II n=1 Tax=Alicyclobacillus sp. SP_1 TaxID=2942475 RepID=UPI0021577673|nr:cytochrome d ubiquinol oxidase subunit II [Alicyclobacillus sp. SP_1]MCY0889287.1 cytochrome d ubiquinol oxidase subunit II [Alicyclobacillaceae bacterium]
MTDAMWGALLLWLLMFLYAMAGSVDFGAGFWSMWYADERELTAGSIANRYLSPLWEVTNVFLVLFAVAVVGLFPGAAFQLGDVLLVPGGLILILLTLRTVFMAYAHAVERHARLLRIISGVTGLLIPALLLSIFAIAEGGFVYISNGHPVLALGHLFTSPVTWSYIALGILSEITLAAVILADFSDVQGDATAFQIYRRHALQLSPIALLAAAACLAIVSAHAPWLAVNLWSEKLWFIGSAICYAGSLVSLLLAVGRQSRLIRAAAVWSVAQYFLATIGYGRAHLPYFLYPTLTVDASFTNSEMFRSVMIVLLIGLAILFPGFLWLWRLFLGRHSGDERPSVPRKEGTRS